MDVEQAWRAMLDDSSPSVTGRDPSELCQELGIDHDDLTEFIAQQIRELIQTCQPGSVDKQAPTYNVCVQICAILEDQAENISNLPGGDDGPIAMMYLSLVGFKLGFLSGAKYIRENVAEMSAFLVDTEQGD